MRIGGYRRDDKGSKVREGGRIHINEKKSREEGGSNGKDEE